MKLTVGERLILLQILPKEGNFITLRVLQELKSILGLTEKEIEKFGEKTDGRVSLKKDALKKVVDISIGETAKGIVVELLKKMDTEKKLHENYFTLYEKFVEGKEEEKPKASKKEKN